MIQGQKTLSASPIRTCRSCAHPYNVLTLKSKLGPRNWIGKYCGDKCRALGQAGVYTNAGRF